MIEQTITRADRWLMFALALYGLGVAAWVLVSGVRITQEDGFYYLKIAQNIARGTGSTFDGLHPTNGYHPLWLLLLIPLFWLTASPDTAITLSIILQALLTVADMLLLYRIARLSVGRWAASLAALLWMMLVHKWLFSTLEFNLYALCVLGVMYVYLRWFKDQPDRSTLASCVLGLLLSLTFLARTDSLVLAGVIALLLIWRAFKMKMWQAAIKHLLILSLPVLLVSMGYAIFNLILFGSPISVSAAVKRDWAEYWLAQDPRDISQGWWAAKLYLLISTLLTLDSMFKLYLVLGSFGVGVLWLLNCLEPRHVPWHERLSGTLQPLQPFIWFSVLNVLGYILFLHSFLSFAPWYYVMQPILVVLLMAALADAIPKRLWLLALMLLIWLSIPLYTLRSLDQLLEQQHAGTAHEPLYLAAQWARARLPQDAIIGAWNAGTIGYLSERRVINLDGVVNSWEYFRSERFDLCHYWQEEHVTFLIDAFEDNEALSVVPTYSTYARCADRLELIWSANPYNTSWHIAAYRIRPAPISVLSNVRSPR